MSGKYLSFRERSWDLLHGMTNYFWNCSFYVSFYFQTMLARDQFFDDVPTSNVWRSED